ncbi:zinc finger protein 662-like [Lytechinus variegatus]|uniref:zinc finger protein 662-like n=1 Tax=Lytechinus variegatus TaxID=7654 RepID=UPI001BB246C6|nr:zinc finger protein 662-like [Lytechinus variegatus]
MALPLPPSQFDIHLQVKKEPEEIETCGDHRWKGKDDAKRTDVVGNVHSLRSGTGHQDEPESGMRVEENDVQRTSRAHIDENKDVANRFGHPKVVVTQEHGLVSPLILPLEVGSSEELAEANELQDHASDCADLHNKSTLPRFVYGICNTSSFKRRKKEAAKSHIGQGCSSLTSSCTKVVLPHGKSSSSLLLCNVNGHQSASHLANPKGIKDQCPLRTQDRNNPTQPTQYPMTSVIAYSGSTFSDATGNGNPDLRGPFKLSFQDEALDLTTAQGKRDGQADFGDQDSQHISYTAKISEEAKSSIAGDGGQCPEGSRERFLSITGMIQRQELPMMKCYEVKDTLQETEGKEPWSERSDHQDCMDSHPMIGYYGMIQGGSQLGMPSDDAAPDTVGGSERTVRDNPVGIFEDCSRDGLLDHDKNEIKHSLMGYYRVIEESDHSEDNGDIVCQEERRITQSDCTEANAGDDPIKRFKCKVCGRAFRHSQGLTAHKKIHSDERPFPCQYCDLKFRVKQNLITHVRTHTGEKPYSCEICGRGFGQQSTMVRHLRSHTGEKPFSCKYCQRKFTQRHVMMNHVRIHTGEKPYSCEVCSKDFKEQHNLVRHVRTHTGEKPYTCGDCGNKFTQKNHLMRHAKVHIPKKHTI